MLIAPILQYYQADLHTIIETDASNKVIASILS
jgi:hypothetical protein